MVLLEMRVTNERNDYHAGLPTPDGILSEDRVW